jgi:hypothetical protein
MGQLVETTTLLLVLFPGKWTSGWSILPLEREHQGNFSFLV